MVLKRTKGNTGFSHLQRPDGQEIWVGFPHLLKMTYMIPFSVSLFYLLPYMENVPSSLTVEKRRLRRAENSQGAFPGLLLVESLGQCSINRSLPQTDTCAASSCTQLSCYTTPGFRIMMELHHLGGGGAGLQSRSRHALQSNTVLQW